MPTNYAFGGNRLNIKPAASASVVAPPRFAQSTQDRLTGVTQRPALSAGQRPDFGADTDQIRQDVQTKSSDINDFGKQQLFQKQLGALKKNQAAQAAQQQVKSGQQGTQGVRTSGGSGGGYSMVNYNGQGGTGQRAQLVKQAMSLQGQKYAWGGGGYGVRQSHGHAGGPGSNVVGVDCSGLTSYAYGTLGIKLPRTARGQLSIGYKTAINNLQPGDLVVWDNGKHTSMYMGNGQIVESVPSTGPRVRNLRPGERVTGVHIKLPGE